MTFDQYGDPPARYELVNLQQVTSEIMSAATVAVFDSTLPHEHQFQMNGKKIVWGGGSLTVHNHITLMLYFRFVSHNAILHQI